MKNILGLLAPALTFVSAGFYKITPAKPTVASALAGFAKVKDDLAKVKEHHDAEADKHAANIVKAGQNLGATIAKAQAQHDKTVREAEAAGIAATEEAIRAARALAKVEDFLS